MLSNTNQSLLSGKKKEEEGVYRSARREGINQPAGDARVGVERVNGSGLVRGQQVHVRST